MISSTKPLRTLRLDEFESVLEQELKALPCDAFDPLIGLRFNNSPPIVLNEVNRFVAVCSASFNPKAIYLEMNGFDINTDRWYFDFFGYDCDESENEDLDWLSDWQSPPFEEVSLTGLEPTQQCFATYVDESCHEDPDAREAWGISVSLVVIKFAILVRDALASASIARPIPLLVTAHDFDSVARFNPRKPERG